MIKERFADSERFIFKRGVDEKMHIVDCKKEFLPVQIEDKLSEILSEIMWEHYQFVKEKEQGLFKINNLRDFVKENNDLDNDILIAIIKSNGVSNE